MSNDLVQIGHRLNREEAAEAASSGEQAAGISRRKFLKILGVSSAAGVAGCADPAKQPIFPHVKGDSTQVPGVAVWYRSTCTECSAGCGIEVRTREGRAVKIEGSPDNPVNRGGLCALGQSALQHLYDPDRVREPLKRVREEGGRAVFEPVSWDEAKKIVSDSLQANTKKGAFITGELTGSLGNLIREWCAAFNTEHVTYDLGHATALAKASEWVYGTYGIPQYSFADAKVILNFGADFLETWVSPCGYARDWARSRKSAHPCRVIHVEPRLSLTAANADMWLAANPGSEVRLALAVLSELIKRGKGANLSQDKRSKIEALVKDLNLEAVAVETGVSSKQILLIANYLAEAEEKSLVLAGGTATCTQNPMPLHVAVGLINLVLKNVGGTVNLVSLRKPKSSLTKIAKLVEAMKKDEVGAVFIYGADPQFSLPSNLGFQYGLKTTALVVSFSSHLDDTASRAHLILPSHTSLESWGDVNPMPGIHSLLQPVMTPIFNTRALGDSLIEIAALAGKKQVGSGATTFKDYVEGQWKDLYATLKPGAGQTFQSFWSESLERGGYFDVTDRRTGVAVKVSEEVFDWKFEKAAFNSSGASDSDLIFYPFPSVKSFDGRSANRPWIQELPDPLSQVVWDAWAELHPDTAGARGIKQGDLISIKNDFGEISVPAYVTEHVHRGIVAVPLGLGHENYGRFARNVQNANSIWMLSGKFSEVADVVPLLSERVRVGRALGRAALTTSMGSDTQGGRELAKTTLLGAGLHGANGHGDHGSTHGAHHEPKQMYEQRVHPLYRWGMVVDLAACTGCSACVVACYAENNIPVVGKKTYGQGREMAWLRIERYYYDNEEVAEELQVSFLPMMCQQCTNAPCEPVCPVYATYHNEEGLNAMIYNRCVGTRYCSNNCPYKVRRFNWFEFDWPSPLDWQLNPDVTKRSAGVMEKCTFCVQRIAEARDHAKDAGRTVADGEVRPACVQSCPTEALTFGDLNNPKSAVTALSHSNRAYRVLDHHLNTQPAVIYLERVRYAKDV